MTQADVLMLWHDGHDDQDGHHGSLLDPRNLLRVSLPLVGPALGLHPLLLDLGFARQGLALPPVSLVDHPLCDFGSSLQRWKSQMGAVSKTPVPTLPTMFTPTGLA
eukprot:709902-Rhodomonas_salina.1